MVAQGDENSPSLMLLQTPLLAVSPIPSKDLFPIPPWRARDGRGPAYDKWWRAVQSLLNAFDITVDRLGEQPPAIASSAQASIITRAKDEEDARAAEEQRSQEHARALDIWQRYNTAVYWHVPFYRALSSTACMNAQTSQPSIAWSRANVRMAALSFSGL